MANKKIDISGLSIPELASLREQVEARHLELVEQRRMEIAAQFEEMAGELGMSAAAVLGAKVSKKGRPRKSDASPAAPTEAV